MIAGMSLLTEHTSRHGKSCDSPMDTGANRATPLWIQGESPMDTGALEYQREARKNSGGCRLNVHSHITYADVEMHCTDPYL